MHFWISLCLTFLPIEVAEVTQFGSLFHSLTVPVTKELSMHHSWYALGRNLVDVGRPVDIYQAMTDFV